MKAAYAIRIATCTALALGTAGTLSVRAAEAPGKDELPPKTKMAVKLAGLVSFVASSCPELQTDYGAFKKAVEALGVAPTALEKNDLKFTYLSYAMRYKQDATANCARAVENFGPKGTIIANIVKAK